MINYNLKEMSDIVTFCGFKLVFFNLHKNCSLNFKDLEKKIEKKPLLEFVQICLII